MGWTVRGSNAGGGEIFRTCPDGPWGQPSHLYNGYRVFPDGKAAGAWCWLHTPSSAEVKERVELYLYSSPPRAFVACSRANFSLFFTLAKTWATRFWNTNLWHNLLWAWYVDHDVICLLSKDTEVIGPLRITLGYLILRTCNWLPGIRPQGHARSCLSENLFNQQKQERIL
jgi:hypothetical protein